MKLSDAVAAARDAHARHQWQDAYDAATAAGEADEPAQEAYRLDLLADTAWWLGHLDRCIDAREQAYAIYHELDDRRRAGQCAVWLYEHHCFKARPAIAGAWLRRAQRALADDPDCAEHGAVLLREAEAAHGAGDLDRAAGLARAVVELGRRLLSPDVEAEALQTLGRVLIDQGQATDGLAFLDEAMLFAVEGRLGPYSTGKVYCSLISACEALGDLRRATEWTEATSRWSRHHPFAVFPGLCRVHRASALRWHGSWADAEREATLACDQLAETNLPNAAAGFEEIGEIRRRVGDLDGAEEAFARAEALCGRPPAGLALLRLAQRRNDAATAIIRGALEGEPWNRLARARLLSAAAQIAIAAGDTTGAVAAVDELEAIASDYQSPLLLAAAATARGRLALAQGDPSAYTTLRAALRRWQELDVPHEVATARTLLGLACRDLGDHDGALESFTAAQSAFEHLGATLDARAVHDLTSPRPLPGGLTQREVQVLRLVASGRTNREIAAELYLSEKTVARHLSNIFTKIGVASRSAATAYAFGHRLVERA
ncbi:MAG: LuxR C-terminal-related transcriptional regulator [Acidimicrobiia bacterium]